MVKQVHLPTFFITLSCGDLQRNKLISIITRWTGKDLDNGSINAMDFFERCIYLNLIPVLLVHHLQYRG